MAIRAPSELTMITDNVHWFGSRGAKNALLVALYHLGEGAKPLVVEDCSNCLSKRAFFAPLPISIDIPNQMGLLLAAGCINLDIVIISPFPVSYLPLYFLSI